MRDLSGINFYEEPNGNVNLHKIKTPAGNIISYDDYLVYEEYIISIPVNEFIHYEEYVKIIS